MEAITNAHQAFKEMRRGVSRDASKMRTGICEALEEAGLKASDGPVSDAEWRIWGWRLCLPKAPKRALADLHAYRVELGLEPPTVHPPPASGPRLTGRLVIDESGPRPLLRDASGPVLLRFCSWFQAPRVYREDRDAFSRTLDRIGRYWQGARIFAAVGGATEWPPGDRGWLGLEIAPVSFTNDRGNQIQKWSDYDVVMTGVFEAFQQRGLRVFLTSGDLGYIFSEGRGETGFHERLGRLSKPFGDTVAFYETANERWQNAHDGRNVDRAAQFARAFRAQNPRPLILLSSPQEPEELQPLRDWSRPPADLATKHGTRQPFEKAVRRTFNLAYERVQAGELPRYIVDGEPTGPGGDVYQETTDPDELFGIYMMHLLANCGSVLLTGGGIRFKTPIDEGWGFKELPALMDLVPTDIGTYRLVPGHRGDAPIHPVSFADQGQGPHRVDAATNGRNVVAMVYGGRGDWDIRTRWPLRYRVVSARGASDWHTAAPGATLRELSHANQKARLVIGERVG